MKKIVILGIFVLLFVHLATDGVSREEQITDTYEKVYEMKSEEKTKDDIITHVTLTCYQPVVSQCDDDPLITADGSFIDLDKLERGEIKWCAISRDLLWLFPKDKPKRVHIEGYGIYEVRDVMNKKWEHRLDILLHPSDNTMIMEKNVKVTILDI